MALRITGLGEEIAAVTGLPWNVSLEEWPEDPLLAEKRGISRHIVRLVRSTDDPDSEVYAVKETVSEFANREICSSTRLKTLLSTDSNTNMGLLNHWDVIRTVPDGKCSIVWNKLLCKGDYFRFLTGRAPRTDDTLAVHTQLHKL